MTVELITNPQRYAAASTDVRPTIGVPVGSVLEELDTGDLYEFLGGMWVQVPTSPGGGGDPVTWGNIGAGGAPDPLGDDISLAFDTGGDYYLRYSTAHGDLYWSGSYITFPGNLTLNSNTGSDGNGTWSPYIDFDNDVGGVEQITLAAGGASSVVLIEAQFLALTPFGANMFIKLHNDNDLAIIQMSAGYIQMITNGSTPVAINAGNNGTFWTMADGIHTIFGGAEYKLDMTAV